MQEKDGKIGKTICRQALLAGKPTKATQPKMRDFLLPIHPEGLLSSESLDNYQVEKENAPRITSLSEKQQITLLQEIENKLLTATRIVDQKNFDTLYFFVRCLRPDIPSSKDWTHPLEQPI